MDILGNLVGGQGCATDGTAAARNPLSRLVDSLMEGSAGATPKGRSRGTHPTGASMRGEAGLNSAEPLAPVRVEIGPQGHGMMGQGGPVSLPPDAWMKPGIMPPGSSEQISMQHPTEWAREFGPIPPDRLQPGGRFQHDFEGAWGAPRLPVPPMMPNEAWANEFHGPGQQGFGRQMQPVMMPHPAEMEAVWAAGSAGPGAHRPHPMEAFHHPNHGPVGDVVPPRQEMIHKPGLPLEQAWGESGALESEGKTELEAAWNGGNRPAGSDGRQDGREVDLRDETSQGRSTSSFSDAWTGLDSGVGSREEPALAEGWAESEEAVAAEAHTTAGERAKGAAFGAEMEAAWEDVQNSQLDPDVQAIWDEADNKSPTTLEGIWGQTAARLESGELGTGTGSREEVPYELAADNRFSDVSDPFTLGMLHFEAGEIVDAALCFEAEIARNPENSQAWLMLGQSHAENDQDRLAITCLERAVEQDPYSLDALLALGTSYVNELDSQRALTNLKAWVQHNPKYAGLEITVDEYSDGTLMDEVMQLMLQAQRWDPTDADAHVVLGVLYNVSRDYDSAAEAFTRALEARPNDHSLWNKLGATLANHRKSEEALPAYRRAIASKPGYARAWLNMGISQANLNSLQEASSCYLQALRLNPEAKHIWAYLRIVFTSMERFDLVQKAGQEDARAFDEDFDLVAHARSIHPESATPRDV